MSAQNKRPRKTARQTERAKRKKRAVKLVPFGGVVVTRADVLGHRYLAVHGLPFSEKIAAVQITRFRGKP